MNEYFLYNETILIFLKRLKALTKEIMTEEMGIVFKGKRFHFGRFNYPLHFVVFERKKALGFFDPSMMQIGIHKKMLLAKPVTLKDLLRHELGHLIVFLTHGLREESHDEVYRATCRGFGWNETVYLATDNLTERFEEEIGNLEVEALLLKVKKLLSLASSTNIFEANLATEKANQILIRYNLSLLEQAKHDDEMVYMKRVLVQTKMSAKVDTIAAILKTFMVSPIINYSFGQVYLEVTGSLANVELADYVATFLDKNLEDLWTNTKMGITKRLHGSHEKTSFMKGVAVGYIAKHQQAMDDYSQDDKKALMVLGQNLARQKALVYDRLIGRTSYSTPTDRSTFELGHKAGKDLSVKRPLTSSSSGPVLSLE